MRFLHLRSYPIYEQLLLEERLLRSNLDNWCLINEGSPPAIVMGISGKREELIDCTKVERDNIPLIKRFSGGGTVVVDENTIFITFICQKLAHSFPAFPEPIMKWTEEIYAEALKHPEFRLMENDYVIGNRKFGGNAQYIKKDRWLHHTSFLWDYDPNKMQYLIHPKKTPAYRAGRPHHEFLCKLSDHFPDKEEWISNIVQELGKRYPLEKLSLEQAMTISHEPVRLSTVLIRNQKTVEWGQVRAAITY